MFIGLVLGGLLAPIDWRLVFLISVPVGLFGTVWAYLKLEERSSAGPARIDWWGNVTFAVGLVLIMVGDHVRDPALRRVGDRLGEPARDRRCSARASRAWSRSRSSSARWRSRCSACSLFRIRAFTFGTLSTLPRRDRARRPACSC